MDEGTLIKKYNGWYNGKSMVTTTCYYLIIITNMESLSVSSIGHIILFTKESHPLWTLCYIILLSVPPSALQFQDYYIKNIFCAYYDDIWTLGQQPSLGDKN